MNINSVELKNFKFHHHLEFDIKNQNCLIYGENGTGKSSIYEGLYSNFYYYKNKDIANKRLNIREKFRHRSYLTEDLEVNITFNEFILSRKDEILENSVKLLTQSIFFANEKVLSSITEGNFFNVINNTLFEHFPQLKDITSHIYSDIENALKTLQEKLNKNEINKEEFDEELKNLNVKRREIDVKLKVLLKELIPVEGVNKILEIEFQNKEFEIEFKFISDSSIQSTGISYKFNNPHISIKVKNIDDRNDFSNHFNEAKLKLIGIAIYFSLVKKYGDDSGDIKLLVLDDFLTSLDMANRKRIIQYILKEFSLYQKIILTHNIQFYNLIIKLLDIRKTKENKTELDTLWDIKHLYSRVNQNQYESVIYDKEENYIKIAKEYIKDGKYEVASNYSRKAYERITNEFRELLELGKGKELNTILETLKSYEENKILYKKPYDLIFKIKTKFENIERILKTSDNDIKKINIANTEVKRTLELIKNEQYNLNELKSVLYKTGFYKEIIMNPASHDDSDMEFYKEECESSIRLLSQLNKILDALER